METATQLLTLEEFRNRYAGLKPYYEYWNGEAVQKSPSTWLHGSTQAQIGGLVSEAGYKVGLEVDLHIDPQWQPVPDVIGATRIEQPYPTKPVEIVVEVLSPDDQMSRVIDKCERYSRMGIQRIFVIDPDHRGVFEWKQDTEQLVSIAEMLLPNGKIIDLQQLWDRLDAELQ